MTKILVVDDSDLIHMFVGSCLKRLGYKDVVHVKDGSEALATIGSGFDLVLMDWEMPNLSGPETLRKIRERGLSLPVIIMTTRNSVDDIHHALDVGADEYVFKPFTLAVLDWKISTVIREMKNEVG